jgi:hypothetical protein
MKTLIEPQKLLSNTIWLQKRESSNCLSLHKNDLNSTHLMGVFSHYRDAKVALEELEEAGFVLNKITLVARNYWRYHWRNELTVSECFDEELFGSNQVVRYFFQRLYQRGKYLLLFPGKKNDVSFVGAIMGRRQGHSEVWYF